MLDRFIKNPVLCNVWPAHPHSCAKHYVPPLILWCSSCSSVVISKLLQNKLHFCKSSPFCRSRLIQFTSVRFGLRSSAGWLSAWRTKVCFREQCEVFYAHPLLLSVKVVLQAFCSLNGLFLFFSVFCPIWRQQLFCSLWWLRSNFGSSLHPPAPPTGKVMKVSFSACKD